MDEETDEYDDDQNSMMIDEFNKTKQKLLESNQALDKALQDIDDLQKEKEQTNASEIQ